MSKITRILAGAAIVVAVVATGGYIVGLWGAIHAVALGNLGLGLWLGGGLVWLCDPDTELPC